MSERPIPEAEIERLGLYAGLRNEEMCWAKWSWIRGGILTVQESTTDAGREWIPKDAEVRRIDVKQQLVDYLESQRHMGDFILKGRTAKEPLSFESLTHGWRRMIREIGLDSRITIYSLRHTYATELLRSGVDLRTVQKLLGHSSIRTTEGYLHYIEPEKHPTQKLPY